MSEKDVLEKLNEMHTDILLTRSSLKVTQEDVSQHHKVLFGNGQEGLKTKVIRIESSQSTAHKMWGALLGFASMIIAWLEFDK